MNDIEMFVKSVIVDLLAVEKEGVTLSPEVEFDIGVTSMFNQGGKPRVKFKYNIKDAKEERPNFKHLVSTSGDIDLHLYGKNLEMKRFKDNEGLRIKEFEFTQGENKNTLYMGKCEECGDAAIIPKKYLNKYTVKCRECTVVKEDDYSVFELFMLHFQESIRGF